MLSRGVIITSILRGDVLNMEVGASCDCLPVTSSTAEERRKGVNFCAHDVFNDNINLINFSRL